MPVNSDSQQQISQPEFADLSGVADGEYENPYDALIQAAKHQAAQIQQRYTTHRITRNSQQKQKMLDPQFSKFDVDPVLYGLLNTPDFVDPRHCLVFWGRPTPPVKQMVKEVQDKLTDLVPSLWTMPAHRLHLTALELTHSKTADEIQKLVDGMQSIIPELTDYPAAPEHRARLVKPMLGYDASAIALSFVPAAGEGLVDENDEGFTYHHLRRDLYDVCKRHGIVVDSRYVVPSSHLTIARFIDNRPFQTDGDGGEPVLDQSKVQRLIAKIEEINAWLEEKYWPKGPNSPIPEGGEWIVGQGQGLDCMQGTIWYGVGEPIRRGKGF